MGAYQDLTPGLTEGLHIGAVIGSRIAQNRLEQQRLDRLFQQTQFANQIQLRDQAIQEAEAARKAQDFQQVQDFAQLVRQTTPGGGDFSGMTPAEQDQAQSTMRERQLSQLPPALLPRELGQQQSDYERNLRTAEAQKALGDRLTSTLEAHAQRQQSYLDERSKEDAAKHQAQLAEADRKNAALQARIDAMAAKTDAASAAAMEREKFKQGEITKRNQSRKDTAAIGFDPGTDPAIYQNLLEAKDAGAEKGSVVDNTYKENATSGGFLGLGATAPQPIDTLISKYETKLTPNQRAIAKRRAALATTAPEDVATEAAPAPAAIAVTPDANAKIVVISPEGKRGTIPASQLDAALKKGYKRAE